MATYGTTEKDIRAHSTSLILIFVALLVLIFSVLEIKQGIENKEVLDKINELVDEAVTSRRLLFATDNDEGTFLYVPLGKEPNTQAIMESHNNLGETDGIIIYTSTNCVYLDVDKINYTEEKNMYDRLRSFGSFSRNNWLNNINIKTEKKDDAYMVSITGYENIVNFLVKKWGMGQQQAEAALNNYVDPKNYSDSSVSKSDPPIMTFSIKEAENGFEFDLFISVGIKAFIVFQGYTEGYAEVVELPIDLLNFKAYTTLGITAEEVNKYTDKVLEFFKEVAEKIHR